jgi:heme O synthase-like polyprenyltransferase
VSPITVTFCPTSSPAALARGRGFFSTSMDLRFLELICLTALAGMGAVAALVHDRLLFATFFGVAMGIAASGIIRRTGS